MADTLKTFSKAMKDIEEQLIEMAKLTQKELLLAVRSLISEKKDNTEEVFQIDKIVDQYDHQIHASVLQLITIQPPLPSELQALATMLRISREYERIGDHAVNIAELSQFVETSHDSPVVAPMSKMCDVVTSMLMESVELIRTKDIKQAERIGRKDDQVDQYFFQNQKDIVSEMKKDTTQVESLANLLLMNRYLERSADHVVNITRQIERCNY